MGRDGEGEGNEADDEGEEGETYCTIFKVENDDEVLADNEESTVINCFDEGAVAFAALHGLLTQPHLQQRLVQFEDGFMVWCVYFIPLYEKIS